jgi:hypothetical protein
MGRARALEVLLSADDATSASVAAVIAAAWTSTPRAASSRILKRSRSRSISGLADASSLPGVVPAFRASSATATASLGALSAPADRKRHDDLRLWERHGSGDLRRRDAVRSNCSGGFSFSFVPAVRWPSARCPQTAPSVAEQKFRRALLLVVPSGRASTLLGDARRRANEPGRPRWSEAGAVTARRAVLWRGCRCRCRCLAYGSTLPESLVGRC